MCHSGGVLYSGKRIKERIDSLARALQNYYLLAYDSAREERDGDAREPEIRVVSCPGCKVAFLRRVESRNAFY